MSQFHFAEEDAESPLGAPAGAPKSQAGTPQAAVPEPPVPTAPSPADSDPFDLSPLSFSLSTPEVKESAAPNTPAAPPVAAPAQPKLSTPVPVMPATAKAVAAPAPPLPVAKPAPPSGIPTAPPSGVPTAPASGIPASGIPTAPTLPLPGAQQKPAGVPVTPGVAPGGAPGAGPKPLQARTPQVASAPGTPQARPAAAKVSTPAIPTPDPAATLAAAAPAALDAESLSQSHVATDGAGARLQEIGAAVESALDKLEGPASWVLRVAFPIAALALAFMLAAVFTGAVAKFDTSPTGANLLKNLALAGSAFRWTFVLTAIAALVAGYQDNRLGAIVAAIGVALCFGAPLGLKAIGGSNIASATIAVQLQKTGGVLLIVGLMKAAVDVMVFLWTLPDRIKVKAASIAIGANRPIEAKQRLKAREANMLSPCWNLPFCREAIRKMCPAFLARTTCWKFKRGCYCDEEMIARIVRGDNIEAIKAPTKISQSRQPPCGRCYIYLEHQTYKFRMLSPLALPASIAISYGLWPLYTGFFKSFETVTTSLWSSLTFKSVTPDAIKASAESQAAAQAVQIDPAQMAMYSQWIFGLLAGFFILIYLSKFIEWAIFKAKW